MNTANMSGDTTVSAEPAITLGRLREFHVDSLLALLAMIQVTGVALDFRSHAQGLSFEEEGFVTPEHAVFYSAFLAIGFVLFAVTYTRRRRGRSWLEAIPAGYGVGLFGVGLYLFAGVGDYLWHATFGFEEGFESLVSPTHVTLAAAAVLYLSTPLRRIWHRDDEPTPLRLLPGLVGLAASLMTIVMFSTFVNPVVPSGLSNVQSVVAQGLASYFLFSAFLVGIALVLSRRFRLPFGTFALLYGSMVAWPFVFISASPWASIVAIPMVLSGLACDVLLLVGRPTADNPWVLRAFGVVPPLALSVPIVATIVVTGVSQWLPEYLAAAILFSVIAGLMVTYVVVPSARRPDVIGVEGRT